MKFKKAISGLMVGGLLLSSAGFAFGETIGEAEGQTAMVITERAVPMPYGIEEEAITGGNLSEGKALDLAKEYIKGFFGETINEEDGFQTNASYRGDWQNQDQYVWQIGIHRRGRDTYVSYNVTIVDEDASLLEIRKYGDPAEDEPKAAQFTQEEAEEKALAFLKEFNPKIMQDLILDDNYQQYYHYYDQSSHGLHPREYGVFYTRQYKGIPVMNQGVQIGVNNATGKVTSYRITWNNETIPEAEANITAEDAKEVFKDDLNYELLYVPVRDRSRGYSEEVEKVRLVYAPNFEGGAWVDAETGKMLTHTTSMEGEEIRQIDVSEREKEAFKKLTAKQRDTSKEMTREEVTKFVEKTLGAIYPDNEATIQRTNYSSSNYYGMGGRRKAWDIQFEIKSDYRIDGSISVDAQTGEVLRFNLHNWRFHEMMMSSTEEFTPEVEWEDAYYTAIETLKQLYPDKLKSLDLQQTYYEQVHHYNDRRIINPEYHFNFRRVENDIPYRDNQINISIDSSNGLLQSVHYRWNEVELPEPKELIEEEEGMDSFMKQSKVELSYVTRYDREKEEQETKLVYVNRPKNSVIHQYIDAHSGELVDFYGQSVEIKDGEVKEINGELEGHWAERELKIMAANGVVDFEKLSLGDKMTKNEIVKMMVSTIGNYYYYGEEGQLKFTDIDANDEYYEYIDRAVMYRFIDNEEKNFDGYKNISREEFAELLVNMTSLQKAAELQGIYTLPVEDIGEIDEEKLGAVALLYGLDIMKGAGEEYRPKAEVTLEQAAVGIYRAYNIFGRPRW
ncbi:MAG: S-layer homology domain-containing protein [Clostridiaceae bacterium]|nr:S-layer homology domain-containing protein [Clostridiaceae bacterium]